MEVLVTGARGFVGMNVARTLARRGATIWAVDRSPVDKWVERYLDGEADSIHHVVADLSMPGDLMKTIPTGSIDAVVHAAVITATTVEVEQRDARDIIDTNIGGTVEALQAAIALDAERFIYVSSPSAFGVIDASDPIDESVEPRPDSLYGITKWTSEQIVDRWRQLYGLSAASIRIAQPFGPGERATSARIRTSPIWEWLRAAEPGATLPTGPLDRRRDWTYIDDIAEGIARAVESERLSDSLYHLGCGVQTSVGEVLKHLRDSAGVLHHDLDPKPGALNPNISGPARPPLDPGRFAADFGWKPDTSFDVGMSRYIQWWNTFQELIDDE